jgi:2-dehydro-3-deoxyphosphogluconate aldolase/(4S)-4-hydroxy-2-oxoglutarate aldolase
VADTLVEVGISCLEITTNTPGGLEAVSRLCRRYDSALHVGVGTVLNIGHVRQTCDAGTGFVVAPTPTPRSKRPPPRSPLA